MIHFLFRVARLTCLITLQCIFSGCISVSFAACPYRIDFEYALENDSPAIVTVHNESSKSFVSFELIVAGPMDTDSCAVSVREFIPPDTSVVIQVPLTWCVGSDVCSDSDDLFFFLGEIRFADNTVWRDPFGRYGR